MSEQSNAITMDGPESLWYGHKGNLYAMLILGVVAIGSVWALSLDTRWIYLLVYVWFGVGYGVLLQYGRFCMASAVRDLFAVGVPRMAVGMLIAVVLFSLTAAIVKVMGVNTFHPHPIGWHVIIGGAIFGFGIVFTGGCASGSLYKSGEGNLGALLVVLSISFSQAIYVTLGGWFDRLVPASWTESAATKGMPEELTVTEGWFDQFTAGYIWDLKGTTLAESLEFEGEVAGAFVGNAFLGAILPSLVLLVYLYMFAYRKGYLRRYKIEMPKLGDHLRGIWSMVSSSRNTAIAGLGLGLLAGLHMWATGALRDHYQIFNFGELLADMGHTAGLSLQDTVFDPGYWYITTQEAQWGAWVMEKAGMMSRDNIFFGLENGIPNPIINAPGWMSIGIIFGAAVIALSRREFKWKVPNLETAMFALIGGALMGLGARLAMGCNIGAFFATVTNGDLSGWVFLAGMTLGGYLGVKGFSRWMEWRAGKDEFDI
ncbi:MAG: YeeE/YedE family protein [Gammaproteobacteria bacterium]|nr:YeeE/YedE family protein [Gammaproteobacteria bacterium]